MYTANAYHSIAMGKYMGNLFMRNSNWLVFSYFFPNSDYRPVEVDFSIVDREADKLKWIVVVRDMHNQPRVSECMFNALCQSIYICAAFWGQQHTVTYNYTNSIKRKLHADSCNADIWNVSELSDYIGYYTQLINLIMNIGCTNCTHRLMDGNICILTSLLLAYIWLYTPSEIRICKFCTNTLLSKWYMDADKLHVFEQNMFWFRLWFQFHSKI